MESLYNNAIEKYYTYKSQYEEQRNKKKDKIKSNDNLSMDEKKLKIKQLKMPCLFCNRKVNMIFKKDKKIMNALCGDATNPCDKKIVIKTCEYLPIQEALQLFDTDTKEHVEEIINIKSRMLLQMDEEETLLSNFEEYIGLYNDTSEIKLRLENKLNKITPGDENEYSIAMDKLKMYKSQIKDIIQKYETMNDTTGDKNPKLLREVNQIYISYIKPLEEAINALKFKHREVSTHHSEGKRKTHHMFVYPTTIKEKEVIFDLDDPEVIQMDV